MKRPEEKKKRSFRGPDDQAQSVVSLPATERLLQA